MSNTTYSSNALDTYSRLVLSTSHLSHFYYFWTTSWWSSAITVTIVVSALLYVEILLLRLTLLVVITTVTLLFSSLLSYWLLNGSESFSGDKTMHYNFLLLNPINQYHPNMFLFLISFVYVLSGLLLSGGLSHSSRYANSFKTSMVRRTSLKFTLVSCFTAFLGSWWAFQEGSWGGWWNWDLSEYFSLIIVFFYTTVIHNKLCRVNQLSFYSRLTCFLILVIVLHLFVQYNLTNTSHAFGQDFTRGSILNRKQQLILVAIPNSLLTLFCIWRIMPITQNFKLSTRWLSGTYYGNLLGYPIWVYLFTLTLLYATLRAFTKSTSTLMSLGGFSIFFYTFTWRVQVIALTILLILLSWGWGITRGLMYSLYIHSPVTIVLLVLGNSYQTRWKVILHVVLLTTVILTPLYTTLIILVQGLLILPGNHLNFSLEVDYWASSGITLGTNFIELQANFMRLSHLNYVSSPFMESTTGSVSNYSYYLASSYPEQRLCLNGLYSLWFVYELELAAPILAAAVSILVVSLLNYLSGKTRVTI